MLALTLMLRVNTAKARKEEYMDLLEVLNYEDTVCAWHDT